MTTETIHEHLIRWPKAALIKHLQTQQSDHKWIEATDISKWTLEELVEEHRQTHAAVTK